MDMSRVYHVCMDECEVANSDVNGNQVNTYQVLKENEV